MKKIKEKNKKRIAIIATVPKMIKFFIIPYILELSNYYEIIIYTNKKINIEVLNQLPQTIKIYHVPFERNINLIKELFCLSILIYKFSTKRYDLVYSISPKGGFLSTLACLFTRTKNIHVFTGQVWITKKGLLKFLLILIDKFIAHFSNLIFIDSYSQKKILQEKKILNKSRNLKVLGMGSISGVNLNRFKINIEQRTKVRLEKKISKNDVVFLFVGRLNKDKGIDLLIRAFSVVQKLNPNTFLWLVGDDEQNYSHTLQNIIDNPINISFFNYVENPMNFMNGADILCLPSLREGFGNVIIEAAACGLPCIGSNIYGISDAIIEKKTGLLFEKGNVDDLVHKMKFLLKNTKIRKKLSLEAYFHATINFNQTNYVNSFIKIIRNEIG